MQLLGPGELIRHVRHGNRRRAGAQRRVRRAGAAMMDDGGASRKDDLVRRPPHEQDVDRSTRRLISGWTIARQPASRAASSNVAMCLIEMVAFRRHQAPEPHEHRRRSAARNRSTSGESVSCSCDGSSRNPQS